MRRSKTLARWRAGEPVRMCALGHYIPPYIKMAAHFGYDCIWLDLEHRAMDDREVQSLLAFFHLADIDCLLRAPTLEKTKLYRYLEDGAAGIMIPHVSTAEKARQLVQMLKFPPLGDRGLDGAGLDCDFVFKGGDPYPGEANAETFIVVQIETIEAVENVDEIAAVEGIDAMFIGPGDLGLRLKTVNPKGLTLEECTAKVAAAAKKHGKVWGQPAFNPGHLKELIAQGARIPNFGGEFGAMLNSMRQWSADWDQALGTAADRTSGPKSADP